MNTYLRICILWLPIAVAITGLTALIYLSFQQTGRLAANDPQIGMAEDAALALEKGADPVSLVPDDTIELSQSVSPFIMIFDNQGDFVVGNASLDGEVPTFPAGLLDESTWIDPKTYHQAAGAETRVTWQPEAGVRQALVIVHATNGQFVAVGRSLRDTEDRVHIFGINTLIAWLVTMAGSLFFACIGGLLFPLKSVS